MKRPLLILFFLTALMIFLWYPREYQPDPIFPQGQYYTVTIHGRLQTYTSQASSTTLTLKDCRIEYQNHMYQCEQLLVTVTADTSRHFTVTDTPILHAGNSLTVTGSLSSFQPARNPGNFDWRAYYLSRHISYRVYADTIHITDTEVAFLQQSILSLRQFLIRQLESICSDDPNTAALLTALLLGDKTALPEDIEAKYETGGILHILTVSGLHVSLLGTAILTLGRKLHLPPWLRSILSAILVLVYWQLCGGSMSAGRAAIMFLCLTAAPLLQRSYDSLSALSLAGLLILWDSPLMLFQAGFQLSFGAILGIQLVCPPVISALRPSSSSGNRFWSSLTFGLGLQLTLFPITLYHFFRYPLYSIFLNLLILPLSTPLILLGAGALVLSAIIPPPISPAVSHLLLLPCRWILTLYDFLCELTLSLPHASTLLGRPAPWRIFLYYSLLLFFCLRIHKKKHDPVTHRNAVTASRRSAAGWILSLLILLTLPVFLLAPLPNDTLMVTFLDVGQGDCCFLQTSKGTNILIDCGSSDIDQVATYRLIPFLESLGVSHLDYVFISHTDQDHTNGILEWLDCGGTIGTVIVPALPDTLSFHSSYQNILARFEAEQIPLLFFSQGTVWQEDELTLSCLAPVSPSASASSVYQDLNTASLVLLAQYQDIRILFTGDCEQEGEQLLLSYLAQNEIHCHILKAGHHGSGYATEEDLLRQLQPQAVIVSCGIRNVYGHPHPDMLARVTAQGAHCHVTAGCGAVTLTIRHGKAYLKTFLPPGELFYR